MPESISQGLADLSLENPSASLAGLCSIKTFLSSKTPPPATFFSSLNALLSHQDNSFSWTPHLIVQDCLDILIDKAGDQQNTTGAASIRRLLITLATNCPPGLAPSLVNHLKNLLDDSSLKFRCHIAVLNTLESLVDADAKAQEENPDTHPPILAPRLHALLPSLLPFLRHSRPQLVDSATKTARALVSHALSRTAPDLLPRVPLLVDGLANPDAKLDAALNALASHVWTRNVDSPTLALLLPLLSRSLAKSRSPDSIRVTLNICTNIFKLIASPDLAREYALPILPHIDRISDHAAYPETRSQADETRKLIRQGLPPDVLALEKEQQKNKIGNENPDDVQFPTIQPDQFDLDALNQANQFFAQRLQSVSASSQQQDNLLVQIQNLIINALVNCLSTLSIHRIFDTKLWESSYISPAITSLELPLDSVDLGSCLSQIFLDADSKRQQELNKAIEAMAGATGEKPLINLNFSLAYGGRLLLNHTTLYLLPGARYGVCGRNGAGKSTLLNAIRDRRIDGFPNHIRCAHVEHNLDGEESAEYTPLDYLLSPLHSTPNSKPITKDSAMAALRETCFIDDPNYPDRSNVKIGSLSGGWKMRLALARAIASQAELYLLDEPTNHLDRASIDWLQSWLVARSDISALIVSHDSSFLDAVCTHIIHYEEKRLVYYPGNLAKFVEKVPAARSYYTLSASVLKFSFPPPGSLSGVRSQTRAILKMSNINFTYEGAPKPSLHDVSCAVSLSSRVGIVGPNGAGKSTLIKVLTGEVLPDSGIVNKHPNLRVALMSQHAFEHLQDHLEKSASAYIKWRYQDGHDRELAQKATRRLTPEEKKLLETPLTAQTGEQRFIEAIIGRQKLKKSFTYEIKWKNLDHRYNDWIPRERLIELGFGKLIGQFDDFEASREGSGTRELSGAAVRQHLAELGLDGDVAEHNPLRSLSGGQKVKVVLAAALWAKPQMLILDEPTNFLDRDALGGLAVAIRDWAGAFVCISHNEEFINALCPEIWHVDNGRLTHKGKKTIVDDAFDENPEGGDDGSKPTSKATSRVNSRVNSRKNSPAPSAAPSAAPSDAEGGGDNPPPPVIKKKKMTRKQLKEREERRRLRTVAYLSSSIPGVQREPDTDSD